MVLGTPKLKLTIGVSSESGLGLLQNFTKAIKIGKWEVFRQLIRLISVEIFISSFIYSFKYSIFFRYSNKGTILY